LYFINQIKKWLKSFYFILKGNLTTVLPINVAFLNKDNYKEANRKGNHHPFETYSLFSSNKERVSKNPVGKDQVIQAGFGLTKVRYQKLIEFITISSGLITYAAFIDSATFKKNLNERYQELLIKQQELEKVNNELTETFKNEVSLKLSYKETLIATQKNIQQHSLVIEQAKKEFEELLNSKTNTPEEESQLLRECRESFRKSAEAQKQIKNIDLDSDISESSILNSYYTEYKKFLETLDLDQLYALTNFFFSIVILSSTISLISIYFGEYLITKLKIEEKFPVIAKYIRLRKKFQRFYLFLSLFYILFCSTMQITLAIFTFFL
jgi:hypothetical protein